MNGPDDVRPLPADNDARENLKNNLADSYFVSAGAGSGKTTAMVDRLVALLGKGIDPKRIVAITFSVASAADIRDRLREKLEAEMAESTAARVLDRFDDLTLTTIHGFALKLLRERGVGIGMPPHLEILGSVEQLEQREEVREQARVRLYSDPACESFVRTLFAAGGGDPKVCSVVDLLCDRWYEIEPVGRPAVLDPTDWSKLLVAGDEILAGLPASLDQGDSMVAYLRGLREWTEQVRATPDPIDRVRLLDHPSWAFTKGGEPRKLGRLGTTPGWDQAAGPGSLASIKEACAGLGAAIEAALAALADSLDRHLLYFLTPVVLGAAGERRRSGGITHNDTLAFLAELLRRDPVARDEIAESIDVLFVDEFQDTDPLQAEILQHLARSAHRINLFTVGDPMQSIYRFRGADVGAFENAKHTLRLREESLTVNFRSTPEVLRAVNAIFEKAMPAGGAQVAFTPLQASKSSAGGLIGRFGSVSKNAADCAEAEAADIALAVRQLRAERVSAYSEITILFPARGALAAILHALEAAGIPARVESRELLMETNEVVSVVAALRAIVQPNDEIAVVAALRSTLFACTDSELVEYRRAANGLKLRAKTPEGIPSGHPVLVSLLALERLRDSHHGMGAGQLVKEVLESRRADERALATKRPRDIWRRYDFILDQARAFDDAGGRSVIDFLLLLDRQGDDPPVVNDRVVAEADDDAVRLMTIHGSKGLEFEAVILAGTGRKRPADAPLVVSTSSHGLLCRSSKFKSTEFAEAAAASKEALETERIRLLYVACTRAEQHLLVSVHSYKRGPTDLIKVFDAGPSDHEHDRGYEPLPLVSFDAAREAITPQARVPVGPYPADPETWAAEREARVKRLARRRSVSATALAHANDEQPAPSEAPVRRRGHGATAVGRAVHGVLQVMPLDNAGSIPNLAASMARAEGAFDRVGDVEKFSRRCLSSAVVQEAISSGSAQREVYVAAPLGDRVIEGFIDLLFADAGGDLVVVDYKTDSIKSEHELAERLSKYRMQGATYALAVERATNRRVSRCVFVFADAPDRLREETIADLDEAKREVEAIVLGDEPID